MLLVVGGVVVGFANTAAGASETAVAANKAIVRFMIEAPWSARPPVLLASQH
jgi:hypothetical protein